MTTTAAFEWEEIAAAYNSPRPSSLEVLTPPSRLYAARKMKMTASNWREQITKYHKDVDFAYRPFLSLLGTGIVTSDGPKWRKQRNKVRAHSVQRTAKPRVPSIMQANSGAEGKQWWWKNLV